MSLEEQMAEIRRRQAEEARAVGAAQRPAAVLYTSRDGSVAVRLIEYARPGPVFNIKGAASR